MNIKIGIMLNETNVSVFNVFLVLLISALNLIYLFLNCSFSRYVPGCWTETYQSNLIT